MKPKSTINAIAATIANDGTVFSLTEGLLSNGPITRVVSAEVNDDTELMVNVQDDCVNYVVCNCNVPSKLSYNGIEWTSFVATAAFDDGGSLFVIEYFRDPKELVIAKYYGDNMGIADKLEGVNHTTELSMLIHDNLIFISGYMDRYIHVYSMNLTKLGTIELEHGLRHLIEWNGAIIALLDEATSVEIMNDEDGFYWEERGTIFDLDGILETIKLDDNTMYINDNGVICELRNRSSRTDRVIVHELDCEINDVSSRDNILLVKTPEIDDEDENVFLVYEW